jgi:hypothetical protein
MPLGKRAILASGVLALLVILLATRPAAAQGSVTPSFGGGTLTLAGQGYRVGERVELTVRAAGVSHQFTATTDMRGRFRLDTGLALPPLSSLEIEARDEQGLTQVTITSTPGASPGPGTDAPLPDAPAPPAPCPVDDGAPAES